MKRFLVVLFSLINMYAGIISLVLIVAGLLFMVTSPGIHPHRIYIGGIVAFFGVAELINWFSEN